MIRLHRLVYSAKAKKGLMMHFLHLRIILGTFFCYSGVFTQKLDSYTTLVNTASGTTGCSSTSNYCTTYHIFKLDDTQAYHITYDGSPLSCCKYGFIGKGLYVLDKYQICVEVLNYNVNDCDLKLQYYFDYQTAPNVTYSCTSRNLTKICADPGQYFDIKVDDSGRKIGNFPLRRFARSRFKIKVTAVKIYNHVGLFYPLLLSLFGGLMFSAIALKIGDICRQRHRDTRPDRSMTQGAKQSNISMTPYSKKELSEIQ